MMSQLKKTDDAVSPVIATILLVAIAVGLAAIIAVAAFGMTGSLEGGKIVSLTVDTQKKTGSTDIILTFTGGADLNALSGIRVTVDSETATNQSAYLYPPAVGTIQKFTAPQSITSGQHRVIVVGTFGQYEQMLYDKEMRF